MSEATRQMIRLAQGKIVQNSVSRVDKSQFEIDLRVEGDATVQDEAKILKSSKSWTSSEMGPCAKNTFVTICRKVELYSVKYPVALSTRW